MVDVWESMAIFYLVFGCSSSFSLESPEVTLFSYQIIDKKIQAIICCYVFPCNHKISSGSSALCYLYISFRALEMFGSCSTDSMALGMPVKQSQVFLVSMHVQAIYTLCPLHAGCRQVL